MSQQSSLTRGTSCGFARQHPCIPLDMSIPHHREWAAESMVEKLGLKPLTPEEDKVELEKSMRYLSCTAMSLRDGGVTDIGFQVVLLFNNKIAVGDILTQNTGLNLLQEVIKCATDENGGGGWKKQCREALRAIWQFKEYRELSMEKGIMKALANIDGIAQEDYEEYEVREM